MIHGWPLTCAYTIIPLHHTNKVMCRLRYVHCYACDGNVIQHSVTRMEIFEWQTNFPFLINSLNDSFEENKNPNALQKYYGLINKMANKQASSSLTLRPS